MHIFCSFKTISSLCMECFRCHITKEYKWTFSSTRVLITWTMMWHASSVLIAFVDLLVFLPTDIDSTAKVNYTRESVRPFHDEVNMKINRPGTMVTSPFGRAIQCSKGTPCDITWEVDIRNTSCPCAFNISCCANGVTISFWWTWDLLEAPSYRFFLDFGGIYIFYNPKRSYRPMSYRIYGSQKYQWFSNIHLPYGTWSHVVIMVKSTQMTLYMDGRYRGSRGLVSKHPGWFPGSASLKPRLRLKNVAGNYSFGKLHVWENKQTAVFLLRQHSEETDVDKLP